MIILVRENLISIVRLKRKEPNWWQNRWQWFPGKDIDDSWGWCDHDSGGWWCWWCWWRWWVWRRSLMMNISVISILVRECCIMSRNQICSNANVNFLEFTKRPMTTATHHPRHRTKFLLKKLPSTSTGCHIYYSEMNIFRNTGNNLNMDFINGTVLWNISIKLCSRRTSFLKVGSNPFNPLLSALLCYPYHCRPVFYMSINRWPPSLSPTTPKSGKGRMFFQCCWWCWLW